MYHTLDTHMCASFSEWFFAQGVAPEVGALLREAADLKWVLQKDALPRAP